MVLLIADDGPLRAAVVAGLASSKIDVHVAEWTAEDLFERALGRKTVVYLAAGQMLKQRGAASPDCSVPDRDRMHRILSAAHAPGIHLLIAVFPEHTDYGGELSLLRKDGVPFVALQSPALLEEVARGLAGDHKTPGSLWLPAAPPARIGTHDQLVTAIINSLETDEQGRLESIPVESMSATTLFARASQLNGRSLRVRTVGRWLFRLWRMVLRWLRGRDSPTLLLAESIFHWESSKDSPLRLPPRPD